MHVLGTVAGHRDDVASVFPRGLWDSRPSAAHKTRFRLSTRYLMSAKSVRLRDGETVRGLFSRHSNGSTRNEIFSADGKSSQLTIRHALRRRVYVKSFDGQWCTALFPGPNFIVMPLRGDFDRPGITVEQVMQDGRPALRLTRNGASADIQTVLPELNFLAIVRETATYRDRLDEIVVTPQPDSDFEPPLGAVVEEFSSIQLMNEAIRRKGPRQPGGAP